MVIYLTEEHKSFGKQNYHHNEHTLDINEEVK